MPTLPNPALTDAQHTEILGAFGTEDAYLQWLQDQIADVVVRAKRLKLDADAAAQRDAQIDALRKSLPGYRPPNPPAPQDLPPQAHKAP